MAKKPKKASRDDNPFLFFTSKRIVEFYNSGERECVVNVVECSILAQSVLSEARHSVSGISTVYGVLQLRVANLLFSVSKLNKKFEWLAIKAIEIMANIK